MTQTTAGRNTGSKRVARQQRAHFKEHLDLTFDHANGKITTSEFRKELERRRKHALIHGK